MDPARVDALSSQVLRGPVGVGEENLAQVVGEAAVGLLGHALVEAAQSGLDMRDRDAKLRRRERSCESRVDVAGDDDQCWHVLEQHLLDADERSGCLLGMRSGSDAEEDVRLRQAQLVDEDRGHLFVVMLAGVDEQQLQALISLGERAESGLGLHEVRPGTDDETHPRHQPRPDSFRGTEGSIA